jgi:hypothetical protein
MPWQLGERARCVALAWVAFVVAVLAAPRAWAESEAPADHAPVVMHVAVVVTELHRLDVATGGFDVELLALVQCDADPCRPEIDVANGALVARDLLRDDPRSKVLRLKASLGATIDLSEYPFDGHQLPIVLEDRRDPLQVVYQIDRGRSAIKDGVRLPGWDVAGWSATDATVDVGDGRKVSQIRFTVDAKRPTWPAALKSVAPIAVMIVLLALTLLLGPKRAPMRLSTATAGLVALVMFQVAQVASLPPVGYLTRFDKLMIATYLVYLVNLALSVVMLRRMGEERGGTKAYLIAAGAVPGLALFVWTGVLLRLV